VHIRLEWGEIVEPDNVAPIARSNSTSTIQ